MAPQSKGKSPKTPSVIERPSINWRENSSLFLSVVREAVMLAPIEELKRAAGLAFLILITTQVRTGTRKNNRSSIDLSRTQFYCRKT